MANRLTGLLDKPKVNRLEGLLDPVVPIVPDPARVEKDIKDTLDIAEKSNVPIPVATQSHKTFNDIILRQDTAWQRLLDMPRRINVPFTDPVVPITQESIIQAEKDRELEIRARIAAGVPSGLSTPETLIHPLRTAEEIAKGGVRFGETVLGISGGTVPNWVGRFIEAGGRALDDFVKLGTVDKDQIYNPYAEAIMAFGRNMSRQGKADRKLWAERAQTGWEALDPQLKEADPVSYAAGRLTEGVASSGLSVLAVYLSGGGAAPALLNQGFRINRGLVALSGLSAAGGFEHAQALEDPTKGETENFLWSTVQGFADGLIEYVMESSFLDDVGKGGKALTAGRKEATEEFFTGGMQTLRAKTLENDAKGMSAYDSIKDAVTTWLVGSPWDIAAGFIGGYGIQGGANLVALTNTANAIPLEVEEAPTEPAKPTITPKKPADAPAAEEPKPVTVKKKTPPLTTEETTQLAERGFEAKDVSVKDARAILAEPPKPRRPRTTGFLGMPVELPEPAAAPATAEKIYQDFINRFASIENAVKKAKALGLKVLPGEDPAIQARSYLGIGRKVEVMLEQKTFRVTKEGRVEFTGEGLKPILDSYDTLTKELESSRTKRETDFNDFLIATRTVDDLQRRAFEGAKQNIASAEQVVKAQSRLDELQKQWGDKGMAVIKEHADRLYAYQRRILHLLVDAGNLSEERFANILKLNPHYIPFDRVIEEKTFEGGVPVSKGRFTKARAPVSRIRGSELEVEPTIESVIKNTYRIANAAERNAVAASLAKLAKVLPDRISPVRVKSVPVRVSEKETGTEDVTIFRASQFAPKGQVIEYFVNGKRKFIEVDGNLFEAMTGLNETSSNLIVKILSKPAHWLRVGATITPEFIARNPIRDQWTALMQTSFGFTPFIDPAGAIADILGKKEIYQEWLASGGAYAGFVELNRPALQKAVKELRGTSVRKKLAKLNIISQAQNLSQLMEMATRLGAFKAAKRAGKPSLAAGFESREASIDFARRGAKMADVNQLTAFFNAGIQGLDKTIRTSINHPYQTALKGAIAITLPSLLLYLRNRREDDYAEMAQWKKDMFWNFKIGENWWRVPKPFLFGQVFGSIPERFLEFADTTEGGAAALNRISGAELAPKTDTKPFDDLTKTLIDSVSPVSGDPEGGLLFTAIKPIIENALDHNFFLQRPIIPASAKELLPPEQFGRYTSETAKQLGRWLDYSPSLIENLVRGYFGGSGRYALQGTDFLINNIRKSLGKKNVPKRPRQLADIPLVKGFVHRPLTGSVSRSVSDFFESADQIQKGWNTINAMKKQGRLTEARGLLSQNPEIQLHTQVAKARKRISDLTKRADKVAALDIPDDDKRVRLRALDDQKLALAKQVNKQINKRIEEGNSP